MTSAKADVIRYVGPPEIAQRLSGILESLKYPGRRKDRDLQGPRLRGDDGLRSHTGEAGLTNYWNFEEVSRFARPLVKDRG